MANDPSSTGNQAVHVAGGSVAPAGLALSTQDQGAASAQFSPNLTQELAHLIAASIAQQTGAANPQAGRSATPTNADLASLAAIMSGAQTARKPLPPYRNELSSLAYSRPMPPAPLQPVRDDYPQPLPLAPVQQPVVHDDEPMPIPSTWRQPAAHDEDKPFSKQLVAAGMGLAAGLVVVVPAVLWMTGSLGPIKAKLEGGSAQTVRAAKVRPIDASVDQPPSYANDITSGPSPEAPAVTTASMTKAAPVFDPGQQMERVLVHARQKVEGGDVLGAREILAGENTPSGPLLFALAETYDPNMLAAWGSRGVAADVQRARALYSRALEQGFGRALHRLDALR